MSEVWAREVGHKLCDGKSCVVGSLEKEEIKQPDSWGTKISRAKLKLRTEDGQVVETSVILREPIISDFFQDEFKDVFNVLIKFYTDLAKQGEELALKYNIMDKLWPTCYFCSPNMIVTEDIEAEGFKLAGMRSLDDPEHAIAGAKLLGKFHALSFTMLEKNLVSPEGLRPPILSTNNDLDNSFFILGINNLTEAMESWGQPWDEMSKKVRTIVEPLRSQIKEELDKDTEWKVISHGVYVCRTNFFNYTHEGHIASTKATGYLCASYASIAYDLTYYLYSLMPALRESLQEDIIKAYVDSFREIKEAICEDPEIDLATPPKCPTLEDVKGELYRFEPLSMVIGLITFPLELFQAKGGPEDDEKPDVGLNLIKQKLLSDDSYIEPMKMLLKHFENRKLL